MTHGQATVIQFNNVTVTYRSRKQAILNGFSLAVNQGEFVLLTGRSGCGKTTVTRLINGLIPNFFDTVVTGDVFVGGLAIKKVSLRELTRKVGSVFQDPRSQFFTLHTLSELAFASENLGLPGPVIRAQIQKTIQNLNMAAIGEKSLFALSSGEKQKVAIASVYTLEPEIYVLDEPSANLDEKGVAQLLAILKTLKAEGRTVIIAEHRLAYLQDLADRVILMADSQKKGDFTGEDFFAKPACWFREQGLRHFDGAVPRLAAAAGQNRKGQAPLLEAQQLAFGYTRGQPVWENLSFCAYAGEITGIMGENGTGKSTLLRVLMGLEKQTRGEIRIAGKPAGAGRRIQQSFYVMQDVDYQLFAPSVWEELLLGCPASPEIEDKAGEYLRFFQLEAYQQVHPAALSGGQKQRLAIALACMRDARLLFFDEPTSGLDGASMEKVSRLLRQLAQAGRCIFVISHDREFASNTFDRVLYLKADGRLIERGE
jgi:energy-coupling factor transport system ATP-binding protein